MSAPIQDQNQNKDKRRALGRGLDALLPSSRPQAGTAVAVAVEGVREIPLELIDRNPFQTRSRVDEPALEELAASIRASGVLQPVVVRPVAGGRYQLMAGERRWMASQRAGKQSIPAVVRAASDEQAMEITIIENLQREDLNPMEQARAFDRLSREFNLTQEQISARTGKDRPSVANHLRLLKLPVTVQAAIEEGVLSFGHGKVLMMLLNQPAELMERAAIKVIGEALSVRQTEELVHELLAPAESAAQKVEKPRDPNVRAAEAALQSTLGCKVEITDRGGRGKIVIHYAALEDFDRVMEQLGVQ